MADQVKVLGVRCSNRDFSYAVLAGTKNAPEQLDVQTLTYPRGFAKPQSLHWLVQEVDGLLRTYSIQKIVIKRFEGKVRGGPFEERVEYEAAVILAGGAQGIRAVFKKMKSTIAKDLGQKGRPKYLANLDTSWVPEFASFAEKQKEAIQAAWSELP
jgi:hypothetical protein